MAPEFKAELTEKDKIDFYTIKVDDKLIDDQVQMYASQAGEFQKAEVFSGNDTLTGDLRELDDKGNTLEGGITTEGGMIMPAYIKDEAQKQALRRLQARRHHHLQPQEGLSRQRCRGGCPAEG